MSAAKRPDRRQGDSAVEITAPKLVPVGIATENDVATPIRALKGVVPSVRERLLRALKAGIPLDEALIHADITPIAYFEAIEVDPELEFAVLAARKAPVMLARAVIRQQITSDWRLARKIIEEEAASNELDRLRALTTD